MLDLAEVKVNVPQNRISDYFWLVSGQPKAGKTTLFAKLMSEYYKGDMSKSLLLAFEVGYQALKIRAVDIEDWLFFEELVEQLVSRKAELGIEVICMDTADIAWEMCQNAVIKEWNVQNPSKRTKDIGGVGGYGIGYARAKERMRTQIDKLTKAGYGIFAITHSKDKSIEEKSGLTYDQLIVSLPSSAREVFVNLADFVVFITTDKELDDNNKVFTKRYIYWRTDGYVEAGSRFANVPQKIEYDEHIFLETFKNAVESYSGEQLGVVNLDQVEVISSEPIVSVPDKAENKPEEKVTVASIIDDIKIKATELRDQGIATENIMAVVGNPDGIRTITEGKRILKKLKDLQ